MGVFQATLPVFMSSATTLASSWPKKSSPSPMARPRFTHPQHAVEIFWSMPDQYSHRISPVLALSAKTSSLPVMTYMMPFFTSGEASNEYLPAAPEPLSRVIHAPLSCLTLVMSTCLSVEYRWFVRLPPLVIQSLPTGLRSSWSISGSAAQAGLQSRMTRPRIVIDRMLPLLSSRRGVHQDEATPVDEGGAALRKGPLRQVHVSALFRRPDDRAVSPPSQWGGLRSRCGYHACTVLSYGGAPCAE